MECNNSFHYSPYNFTRPIQFLCHFIFSFLDKFSRAIFDDLDDNGIYVFFTVKIFQYLQSVMSCHVKFIFLLLRITIVFPYSQAKNILSSKVVESISTEPPISCFSQPKTYLFGFSKGGTVINQLVTELAFSQVIIPFNSQNKNEIIPTSKETLLNSITEIHYIDVGLNSNGAYINDQDVIEKISKRVLEVGPRLRFVLHGTPRQWRDSMRVWIGDEKDTMIRLLNDVCQKSEEKLIVCERFYFANKHANMQMHFEVIEKMDIS